MAFINIAGTTPVEDPEYRYKMPRLLAKIEGRGNGIKTLVVNCADIATALHRSTGEVCKFFGCELGAQSKYDEKSDRAIVNGAFDAGMMQQHLSKYIEGFVLCPSCRLPETKYKFKGQMIYHKCYACGAVEPVDMNHKLTTFILKEHAAAKRAGNKDDEKKKKREKKKAAGSSSPEEPEREEAAVKEKKKKEKKEKKDKDGKEKKEKKKKSKESNGADEDDIEWHTDLSPEAVAARAAEAEAIEHAAQAAMANSAAKEDDDEVVVTLDNMKVDDENAIESAVSNLQRYLSENHTENEIFEELCRQQTYAALPISDRLVIFFQAAFTNQVLSSNQVAKYSPVLERIIDGTHAQYQLIALCEHFCAVRHPELMTSFPIVLKLLYDEDLLEEDCLVAWGNQDSRKEHAHWEVTEEQARQMNELLKPFIQWLENAEEESEEEDDE